MPYSGVTEYADAFTNAASTTHTITLNSTFVSDYNTAVAAGERIFIALLHENDFKEDDTLLETPSTTGGVIANGDGSQFWTMEAATTSNRPRIKATHGDGTIDTIYAFGSGGEDDSNLSGADASGVTARNHTTADFNVDFINRAMVAHQLVAAFGGTTRYVRRIFMTFDVGHEETGGTGIAASCQIILTSTADETGFLARTSTKKTHICKVNPDSTSNWADGDFDSLVGWRSSDTYEADAEESVTHNANFFGSNF